MKNKEILYQILQNQIDIMNHLDRIRFKDNIEQSIKLIKNDDNIKDKHIVVYIKNLTAYDILEKVYQEVVNNTKYKGCRNILINIPESYLNSTKEVKDALSKNIYNINGYKFTFFPYFLNNKIYDNIFVRYDTLIIPVYFAR